jgi:hypothetical protein
MWFSNSKKPSVAYFLKHLLVVVGLVLIWRGVWNLTDIIDYLFFDGNHFWTSFGGIIVGLAILYLPDSDLKEISKL